MWLRQLASDDEDIRQRAINHLGASICHQGWICQPTAYAVPYLIEVLQEPTVRGKEEILNLLTWIAMAGPIHERPWWHKDAPFRVTTAPVPLKDAHAVASAGIPVYIALLHAPALNVRMQAASLLIRFPERAQELWPVLRSAFEREETEQGRINLAFALSTIGRRLPEQQVFFVEQFQNKQNELFVFAAALALAWMEKAETPEEIIRLLTRVAIEAPASLDAYKDFPCGGRGGCAWSAALNALCNLGSGRLQFLAPLLEERLASPRREHAYYLQYWAMLLLFIVFGEETDEDARPPLEEMLTYPQPLDTHWLLCFLIFGEKMETSQPPRPATALTDRQRAALLLVLHHGLASSLSGLGSLLRAYGLPDRSEELAAYLGQEPPPQFRAQTAPAQPATKTQPAVPPRANPIMLYKEAIQAAYSDLRISRTQGQTPDETSQEDYRLMVNGELLFQFPTQAASIEKLEQEVALRRFLKERLPLPILAPDYVSLDAREVGRAFVGYVMPPGKPLYKEVLESIDGEEIVQRLADELALFFKTLHSIPIAELAHLSLQKTREREALEALYVRVREELFPLMPPEQQAQVSARFEAFLGNAENVAVMPTLIHGSFGPEVILYQAKTASISAILGFSQVRPGDPARDVGGLLGPRGYGEAFVRRSERPYSEVATLLERARFYAEAHTLEEQLRRRAAGNKKVFSQTTFYPR